MQKVNIKEFCTKVEKITAHFIGSEHENYATFTYFNLF